MKGIARILVAGRAWKPGQARLLMRQVVGRRRNELRGCTDADHLRLAVRWLARVQDVTGDGGVCGRFSLTHGWTSSYPETTGYLVPTLLALGEEPGYEEFHARARSAP